MLINPLIITSPYGMRTYGGQKIFHNGVDLRSVNRETGDLLPIFAPEEMTVKRRGVDGYGNFFLVGTPMESGYHELKFIHINDKCLSMKVGDVLKFGDEIGRTRVGGNSRAHHLHFEVWKDTNTSVDPVEYFDKIGLAWRTA